jgi:hypothetical protein
MTENIVVQIREANSKLKTLLTSAEEAIAGRRNFTVEDLRTAHGPVARMTPLIEEAKRVSGSDPEVAMELQEYSRSLKAAQAALDRVRVVLLARCASLEAQRAHSQTVGLWSSAWAQTRLNPNRPDPFETVESATYERSASGL